MTHHDILAEIKTLLAAGSAYHQKGQHALALRQYQQAIPLVVPLNDAGLLAFVLAEIGGEHRDCDNYHHAVDMLLKALMIASEDDQLRRLQANIKKLLAITLKDIFGAEKPEVLQLLQEAEAEYQELGLETTNILQHIGGVYVQLGQLAQADKILTLALAQATAAQEVQLQGWLLTDLANLEIERDEWGLALEYARSARKKGTMVGDQEAVGDSWITEARVFMRMRQGDKGLVAAEQALALFTQNKNLRRTIRARRHVAKGLVALDRVAEAEATLQVALQTAVRLDLRHSQVLVYLDLGELAKQQANWSLVAEYGEQARVIAEGEALQSLVAVADALLTQSQEK